jgi:ABC-type phosphate transport system substrate-binding protein
MRRLIAAAAAAATLATMGLTATAQAGTAAPSARHVTTKRATSTEVIEAPWDLPFSVVIILVKNSTEACTKVKATGLPGPVTAGTSSKVNKGCTVEVEGVAPSGTAATLKPKFTYTESGTVHTKIVIFTFFPEPCENDAVGVGSDTITPLTDQLATDYNNSLGIHPACSKVSPAKPYEYSWDAVNPITGAIGDSITEKADCPSIPRPDGSSAGINQLATFQKSTSGPYCTNFARSSRPRGSSDPPYGPGGVAFVALAGDAVTWAAPAVNTAAPASLTVAQLNAIYTCTDTNWDQVGGANQAIVPFLPQSGSGTLSFFLAAIGVTTPGPCVSNDNNTLEENEGVNPVLNNPGAIWIYSVGAWIAQHFHGAKCLNSGCTANSNGVICIKIPGLDQYICIIDGTMGLREIDGVEPTVGSGTSTTINPAFPSTFDRTLFNVVPYDPATTDHIPGATSPVGGLDLEGIFGASGFDCSSATAKADITDYGFLNIATCGSTS